MRCDQRTGETSASAPSPRTLAELPRPRPKGVPGETFTRVFVTLDAFLVLALAFLFGLGNGWTTALRLGIDHRIAPLIQPAVDLAVVGLMVGLRYLAMHGWTDEDLAKPRRWLRIFGAMSLAMNTALPISENHWGRAAWDAIGPILLIAWSELAPWLLRAIYTVRQQNMEQQPAPAPVVEAEAPAIEEEGEVPEAEEPAPAVEEEQPAKVPQWQEEFEELAAQLRKPEVEKPVKDLGPSQPINSRELVRSLLADWKKKGKTYDDEPAAALYPLIVDAAKSRGQKPVGKRRVGQLVLEEWSSLEDGQPIPK